MNSYPKNTNPITKLYKQTSAGKIEVRTYQGFPFGTDKEAFFLEYGKAKRSGEKRAGTHNSLQEIAYTLIS